jgi:hypothetical protein
VTTAEAFRGRCADEVFGFFGLCLCLCWSRGTTSVGGERTVGVCVRLCGFCRALQAFWRKRDASLLSEDSRVINYG